MHNIEEFYYRLKLEQNFTIEEFKNFITLLLLFE